MLKGKTISDVFIHPHSESSDQPWQDLLKGGAEHQDSQMLG